MGNVVSLILMIGVIIAGLIVIGLSITTIVSRINERREDIEREREEKKRSKLAAMAARAAEEEAGGDSISNNSGVGNENTAVLNPAAQKTMAIEENKGKIPGLKTRIMGFKNQKDQGEQEFNYEPGQNQTRQIGGAVTNKDAKESAKKKDGQSTKPTQLINKKPVATPKPMEGFVLPSFDILKPATSSKAVTQSYDTLKAKAEKLKETLEEFGIKANVVG